MELLNFQDQVIRTIESRGETWYSVIDVIAVLTNSRNPSSYWSTLKARLNEEGSQVVTDCERLKLAAADGKRYATDCATRETLLRLIQSIPSSNAEPFKMWLANAGHTTLNEYENPTLLMEKLKEALKRKGYDDNWITARIRSIEVREELTQEWKNRGIKGSEYAVLTDTIMKNTFGLTTREHKELKGLVKQQLRDHFSDLELAFTIIAESTTRQLAIKEDAQGFDQNNDVSSRASKLVGESRKRFEKSTGLDVVTKENFLESDDTQKLDE